MEEKVFAGVLTCAVVIAFVFSIEALAQLRRDTSAKSAVSKVLSRDFQVFREQVP